VNEIAVHVKTLSGKAGEQATEIRTSSGKVDTYAMFWKVFWALVLVAASVGATLLVRKAFPDDPPSITSAPNRRNELPVRCIYTIGGPPEWPINGLKGGPNKYTRC